MELHHEIELPGCPFLTPHVSARDGAFPVPIYCRLPNRHVRVPEADERARFCVPGRYESCPTYRRGWRSALWPISSRAQGIEG